MALGFCILDPAILTEPPFLFRSFGSRMPARSDGRKNSGLNNMGPTQ